MAVRAKGQQLGHLSTTFFNIPSLFKQMLAYFILALFHIPHVFCTPDQPEMTFEELYQEGKVAYTVGEWGDCIAFMRRAWEDYKYYEDELISCRKKCQTEIEKPGEDFFSQYHAESERALCHLRCKRDRFTDMRPDLKKMTTYFDFMERKPYEYLHICYWNMGELSLAVQAAYTFLIQNPGHKNILDALKFYMEQPNYHDDMLVDSLKNPYEQRYMDGVSAYESEDWGRCIHDLEATLEKVIEEDSRCRLVCEDKIDWSLVDGNPDLDVLITSIRASIIRCKHNCLYRLSVVNGHNLGNIITSIYEYLHYCQYKSMLGLDATRSVATYLLFDGNPLMRRNKYFYEKEYNRAELFKPDSVVLEFYKKRVIEERYLKFIEEKFVYENNEFPPERVDDKKALNLEVVTDDEFSYASILNLLSENECRQLRSVFQNDLIDPLIEEITRRVKHYWPTAKYESISCQRQSRHVACDRALILSTEPSDCSEWLGAVHSGCVIVFCTEV
ncbi:unnamed protein product [Auanema sp. JU1783]|nr:unnamed protein product [Auanema sp. JU1783]